MRIAGRLKTETGLQKPLNMRGVEKVVSSGDQSDALQRVVDNHGQMIARLQTFPREHDIAQKVSANDLRSGFPERTGALFFEA